MTINIEKIIVKDRIRKDFGDIQELAEDIKQNGLINPPVVNKDYVLLAGERRLRACKSLGWNQIEVRMMDTRDAEHELNVEISENDVRKGFTKSERVDYMKRLLRIEQAKADERKKSGKKDLSENSHEGRSDEKTAEHFGVSSNTMRKEISIVENKDLLDPSDFANWDEGKLSTNKAFQKIKAEQEKLKDDMRNLREERDYLQFQIQEMEEAEPKTIIPDDYEELKKKAKKASAFESDYKKEQSKVLKKQNEILRLQDEIEELKRGSGEGVDSANISENVFYFCAICNNFISNVGGLVWLTERIADMPEREKDLFLKAARSFNDWSQVFKDNLERSLENGQTRTDTRVPLLTD